MFDLQLGEVALAFCGAGSEQDHSDIDSVIDEHGLENFAFYWLNFKGISWAAQLVENEFNLNIEEEVPWLELGAAE